MVLLTGCKVDNDEIGNDLNNPPAGSDSSVAGKNDLTEAFPDLEFNQPVELAATDDETDRIFVLGQAGIIKVFPNRY